MPSPIKIESTEVEQARAIRKEFMDLTYRLGRVHVMMRELEQERQNAEAAYDKLGEKEAEFLDRLNKKYGEGALNIETGEFTPADSE